MPRLGLITDKPLINILIICGLLSGCSTSNYRAPISDASPFPDSTATKHVVVKGDTLYSIAWRYNRDYKKLARSNKLDKNYRIWPGQVLTLNSSQKAAKAAKNGQEEGVWSSVKATVGGLVNRSPEAKKLASSKKPVSAVSWVWPAPGKLLSEFGQGEGSNQGIDIVGKLGEPVIAAADGEVVYSGSGLRGYGKLLIVKHSEKVLSAYAHNRVLHVAEGDKVKAGQKIAQIGHSGAQQIAKLHFEIRYDGTPVNPLSYLPAR